MFECCAVLVTVYIYYRFIHLYIHILHTLYCYQLKSRIIQVIKYHTMATATNTASTSDFRIPILTVVPLPSSSTNATTSNAANTPSGRALITVLPPGLNGVVSDNDFDDFCRTLNGYINEYDAIIINKILV